MLRALCCCATWTLFSAQRCVAAGINQPLPAPTLPRSCCPLRRGPPLVVSGGDDCEAKLWDLRQKRSVKTLGEKYQVGRGQGQLGG